MKSFVRSLVCLLVLAMALAACGTEKATTPGSGSSSNGAAATNADGLPMYPGAEAVKSGNSLSTVVDAMKQQMKAQSTDAVVDAFVLPKDASFDKIKQFYSDALTTDGWKSMDQLAGSAAIAGAATAVWFKDNGASFTITTVPDPSQNILMVMRTGK